MAVGEVRMPVAAGVELVSRVVQVHQVDASGDGPDALDDPDQVLAARPGMAGVQAETGLLEIAHRVPQPLDRLERASHRVIAPGGVLDEDRDAEPALVLLALEELAPVLEAERGILTVAQVSAVHDEADRTQLGGGDGLPVRRLCERRASATGC